jgi:DNA-binding NarL/FixJ family response regulator
MYDEVLYGERALRAGAMGYLQKETACDQLVAAIERVREGGFFLSQDLSDRLIMAMVSASEARSEAGTPFERLSDRELEVLELLGKGHTTRTAADHLGLSVKTVETYRENIKDKLALEHNNELICCAAHWVADTA